MEVDRGEVESTHLHDTWLWNIVLAIRVAVTIISTLLRFRLSVIGTLPLETRSLKMDFASCAICNFLLPYGLEDLIARNVKSTFAACSRGKRTMTLDHLVTLDASNALDVVDILSVVAQQFILILENPNELMSWRPFVWHWKNIACKLVEHAVQIRFRTRLSNLFDKYLRWVSVKCGEIKDFFWLIDA